MRSVSRVEKTEGKIVEKYDIGYCVNCDEDEVSICPDCECCADCCECEEVTD